MATIRKGFILLACVLSAFATLISIVSLATNQWVVSDNMKWVRIPADNDTSVRYGLFNGLMDTSWPTTGSVDLSMTCLLDYNICAMLCETDDRWDILEAIYKFNGNLEIGNVSKGCVSVGPMPRLFMEVESEDSTSNDLGDVKYINAGVWLSTIIFQIASILFGVISCCVTCYNFISNPYQSYLSLLSVYVYNSIAICSSIIVMLLWGIMYAIIMYHDIGINFTLTNNMVSNGQATLGYSYWLNICPIFIHLASIGALLVRQNLVSKDPQQKMIERENTVDPEIFSF